MEENTTSADAQRKAVQRSAAYPGISLHDAIEFAAQIAKQLGFGQSFDRAAVADALKKSEGHLSRDIAACVHFGLFSRTKGEGYTTTELLQKILNPIDEAEKRISLIEAFRLPKLYEAIIAKFDGKTLPTELRIHLVRFHSISDNAASPAAETFFTSARDAGVLDESNGLNVAKLLGGGVQFAEVITEHHNSPPSTVLQLQQSNLPPGGVGDETAKIRLTEGKYAYLTYPITGLTQKDIDIIRKQIEQIELGL